MIEKAYPRKVDSIGRFTIPKPYLKLMDVAPDSLVDISLLKDGELLIKKHKPHANDAELECLKRENLVLREQIAQMEYQASQNGGG